jgi:mannonate dehydratase
VTVRRRDFIKASLCAPLVSGCAGLTLEEGLMNECRATDAKLLMNPYILAAWRGLRFDRVWDMHVHLMGNGRSDSGVYLDPAFESGWSPASRLRHTFFRNAACVMGDDKRMDQEVVERLVQLADAMPQGAKLVLLAFDFTYDEGGRKRPDLTTFSIPDAYARRVAKAHPDRFEWICSVHPYREDAVQALQHAKEGGARAVKWLPPTMGIDLASPKCGPFYDELVRLKLPLLVHMGEEQAVPGAGRHELANPLLVRKALDRGVRVIVAHCASLGKSPDLDSNSGEDVSNFALFSRLMSERRYEGRLFGDISAVTQANRKGILPQLLAKQRDWEGRLLNGSDYPLPGVMPIFSLKGLVSLGVLDESLVPALRELREVNPLAFDLTLKRNLRIDGKRFPASIFETRPFFERPRPT